MFLKKTVIMSRDSLGRNIRAHKTDGIYTFLLISTIYTISGIYTFQKWCIL
jgi:hypothetical protein